uniref:Uncharacterized protein n=1 Tax=Arundo donax TaxID=35708 RepID=A0A0A9BR34_ARUDO
MMPSICDVELVIGLYLPYG